MVHLLKDDKAPYDGFLFTREKTQELADSVSKTQELTELNVSLNRSIVIYKNNDSLSNDQINILMTRNDSLSKSLRDSRETSTLEKGLWFLAGAVITGFSTYTANRLYSK